MARRALARGEAEAQTGQEQGARGTASGVYRKAEPDEVAAPEPRSLAEQMVLLGSSPTSRHLVAALEHLQERLFTQFQSEESDDGLFGQIQTVAPWLEPRLDNLRREHDHILALCDRLVEDIRQRPRRETVHVVLEVLIEGLREHDDTEHELLQEALNAELGEPY